MAPVEGRPNRHAGAGQDVQEKDVRVLAHLADASLTGELHRVIFVDGIYLARDLVVLIASSRDHVLGWYMAESETARAWECLLAPIPAPLVVVSDGGSGFARAVRHVWPKTRVQRCVFHAFSQVKRYTSSRPRLQAGIELYGLAKDLMHLDTLWQAELWVERFFQWCDFWNDFLEEKSWQDGKFEYTHMRLRKASESLGRLVRQETLFNLPRSGTDPGRAPPQDQQPHRGRGQRTAPGGPQEPQGTLEDAQGQSGLLVVLHAQ